MDMKLSQYARKVGIRDKTAYRWWKAGTLDAYKSSTGMVIVHDEPEKQPVIGCIALSACVSSLDQKSDLERQMQRLKDSAAAKDSTVAREGTEIASGLGDSRPKFLKLLADTSIDTLIVEHKDRGTRCGWNSITTVLETQGRRVEAIFPSETKDDLVNDFVSILTSMAARLLVNDVKCEQLTRIMSTGMNVPGW